MIRLQFKADHPLWGFKPSGQRDYEGAQVFEASPLPLDEKRVQSMLRLFASQCRQPGWMFEKAHALGLIEEREEGTGRAASVTFESKYPILMLVKLVLHGGSPPAEWDDLTIEEIEAALKVQEALARKGDSV